MLVIYDFGVDKCIATSPPVRRALLRALQDLLDTDVSGVAKHLGCNLSVLSHWAADGRELPRQYAEKAAEILGLPVKMVNATDRKYIRGKKVENA